MTDEIREMLKKAERSLLAAQALLDSGDSDFSLVSPLCGGMNPPTLRIDLRRDAHPG